RRVLGENASGGTVIETVPKRGYRFVGTVTERVDTTTDAAVSAAGAEPTVQAPAVDAAPPAAAYAGRSLRRATIWGPLAAFTLTLLIVASSRMAQRRSEDVRRAAASSVARLAVPPFVTLSPPEDAYFAAGINGEV